MVWGQWPTIAAKNVEIQSMIIDLSNYEIRVDMEGLFQVMYKVAIW